MTLIVVTAHFREYTSPVSRTPLVMLIVLFVIGNAGTALAAAAGHPLRPAFLLLYYGGVAWALAWGVMADCRERGIPTSVDHGWFVFYAWPLVVPYHLLKTRGWRGCGVIALLIAAFVGTYLGALVVAALVT